MKFGVSKFFLLVLILNQVESSRGSLGLLPEASLAVLVVFVDSSWKTLTDNTYYKTIFNRTMLKSSSEGEVLGHLNSGCLEGDPKGVCRLSVAKATTLDTYLRQGNTESWSSIPLCFAGTTAEKIWGDNICTLWMPNFQENHVVGQIQVKVKKMLAQGAVIKHKKFSS